MVILTKRDLINEKKLEEIKKIVEDIAGKERVLAVNLYDDSDLNLIKEELKKKVFGI
jgi:G3E family GTPase